MPRRPCSICQRPDADLLRARVVEHGDSARRVALSVGIHPRVFSEHLRRHSGHPIARRRGGLRSQAVLKAAAESFSVQAEAKALLGRVVKILDSAEESGSQALLLSAVREAKGLLDLLGRTTGELATPGQTTVNVALGVSIDRAKAAVEAVEVAEALAPEALADRAVAYLTAYNSDHPDDRRTVA